jgi:hypothetical protein
MTEFHANVVAPKTDAALTCVVLEGANKFDVLQLRSDIEVMKLVSPTMRPLQVGADPLSTSFVSICLLGTFLLASHTECLTLSVSHCVSHTECLTLSSPVHNDREDVVNEVTRRCSHSRSVIECACLHTHPSRTSLTVH